MPDSVHPDMENICTEIFNTLQGILSWKWDDRFEAALAEVSVDDKDSVRAVLDRYLGNTWEKSTVKKAPDSVRVIAKNIGGIMPGQMLLTSDTAQEAFVVAAWWPWGDGKTISVRVSPYDPTLSQSETETLTEKFKGWFGL